MDSQQELEGSVNTQLANIASTKVNDDKGRQVQMIAKDYKIEP